MIKMMIWSLEWEIRKLSLFLSMQSIKWSFYCFWNATALISIIIPKMERTEELSRINQDICNYYEEYTTNKKDAIFCFRPKRGEVSDFYSSMNGRFFQKKLKENLQQQRITQKEDKIKERILSNLRNPLRSSLPQGIKQSNQIQVEAKTEIKVEDSPMFSGVERSKKGSYVMGEEVRQMVSEDIQNMIETKEEELFRKKFPHLKSKEKPIFNGDNCKTENLIKVYNKILVKYKNENEAEGIKLIDECHYPELVEELILDNQFFHVLDLFKKLYKQTKTEFITDGLMKYVLKFQTYTKQAKKIKNQNISSSKNIFKNSSSSTHQTNKSQFRLKRSEQSIANRNSMVYQQQYNLNNAKRNSLIDHHLHDRNSQQPRISLIRDPRQDQKIRMMSQSTCYLQKNGKAHSVFSRGNLKQNIRSRVEKSTFLKDRIQSVAPSKGKIQKVRLRL